jgi:hypothetical protein
VVTLLPRAQQRSNQLSRRCRHHFSVVANLQWEAATFEEGKRMRSALKSLYVYVVAAKRSGGYCRHKQRVEMHENNQLAAAAATSNEGQSCLIVWDGIHQYFYNFSIFFLSFF